MGEGNGLKVGLQHSAGSVKSSSSAIEADSRQNNMQKETDREDFEKCRVGKG